MEANDTKNTSHEALRQAAETHLAGKRGKRYWRSLEELSDTPEFQRFLDDEFPNRSSLMQMNRRDLLKFMGASLALAGLSGCRGVFLPQDKVVPYVKQPEELVPGKPLFYASAVTLAGYATGVLVEQHEGRPVRLEGNPDHPATGRGALDSISQAEVLGFYDPDRVGTVLNRTNYGYDFGSDPSTWEMFFATSREILRRQQMVGGAGIRILTGSITSPTLIDQLNRFLERFPQARWHAYEPAGLDNVHGGARTAFGRPLDAVYNFAQAQVVVSLDSDFFSPTSTPGSLRYAHDFVEGRRVKGNRGEMNRLYAIESAPTLVGAMADHRWTVRTSEVYAQALALAAALGVPGVTQTAEPAIPAEQLAAVARDLAANRGRSIVIAGPHQPIEVHAVVHAINQFLGNFGTTVNFIEPVDATTDAARVSDLGALVQDLNGGGVEFLLIVEGNPVYDAPVDLNFAQALAKAQTKVHLGLYEDETSHFCDWHLPLAHNLEAWGDARAFDGTLSVIQPIISPLYENKSVIEVISQLLGTPRSGYDLVRDTWRRRGFLAGQGDFEKAWRKAVHDGYILTATLAVSPSVNLSADALPPVSPLSGVEITFRPDPTIFDGRYANNGWLQELPKPLTKLTWDNVALMSAATAGRLGVTNDEWVRLSLPNGRSLEMPVFIQPGHPNEQITVHLGYGRVRGGVVAMALRSENDNTGKVREKLEQEPGTTGGGGFNTYALRSAAAPYFEGGLQVERLNAAQYQLATTQGHQPIQGDRIEQFEGDHREIVIEHDLREFNEKAAALKEKRNHHYEKHEKQNLYPEVVYEYNGPQWGMTIDLNTCIGCNACVTACQSENNIPVVGKEQVLRHREMHWLRIDRYYSGDDANPQVAWQPVMCVHCEKAPCEPVCPVAATVHSHEGLNQMVYNRCVGTRYCSNNCPYKVRRFNYLNYTDNQKQFDVRHDEKPRIPLLRMLNNPNVTVRGRGIMEKCTYCVQRINHARIEAKKQNREVNDGEVITACQQACPTKTIVFGNIADRESAVSQWREDPRAYLLLQELQTRPRTSHLAKLRNPNPEITPLEEAAAAGGAH